MAADKDKHTDRHETEAQSSTAVDDSLDEYGVWVKSGPEDVSDEETTDSETIFDLQQDDVPGSEDIESIPEEPLSDSVVSENDMEPTPSISDYPESMDLSEEEEALLADLEDSDSNIDAPDSSETAANGANEGTSAEESDFSTPDDTDFSYDLELPSDLDLSEEDVDTDGLEQDDISSDSRSDALPDLGFPDEDTFTMDLPDEEGAELEIPADESSTQGETVSDNGSLEPEDELENDLEISFEEETSDEDSESDIHFEYADNVEDLPDLEPGDDSESAAANAPVTEISLEEVTNDSFDDVNAVAGEMAEPLAQESDEPGNATGGNYSRQAFQLIQNELASIKSELAGLKEELHDLRGSKAASSTIASPEASGRADSAPDMTYEDVEETREPFGAEPEPEEPGIDEHEESIQAGDGGFFEEDEDETIALTGDELDNILNTAEFIQEQGQPTDFEDSELDLDLSSLEEEEQTGESGKSADAIENFDGGADYGGRDHLGDADSLDEHGGLEEQESQTSVTEEEIEDNIVELDTADEDFAFDLPDSGADATATTPAADVSAEAEPGSQDVSSQEQIAEESEPFGASHEEVDALANMDIDTELADIDELDDSGSVTPEVGDLQESDESVSKTGAELDPEPDSEPEPAFELESEPELESQENLTEAAGEERVSEATDTDTETTGSSEAPAVDHEPHAAEGADELPEGLREEIRSVLSYMDQLLESLPEEKIREFANSEHFEVYKRLFEELELEP